MTAPGDDLGIPGVVEPSVVGKGGYATVYRAWQPTLHRTVAVKVLKARLRDPKAQVRFEAECKAIGRLSGHPNIVPIYDAGQTAKGNPYMVMQFVPGGTLADRVRPGMGMEPADVLDIGVKLCGALQAAHQAEVLHRDVKPENVLVDTYGEPLLADFGIARVDSTSHTATGVLVASLAHAAPELLSGGKASAASDVYGLASTLYQLLAGRPAFASSGTEDSALSILTRIGNNMPDRPSGVPEPVWAAVSYGMTKSRDLRPSTAAAYGAVLRWAQGELGLSMTAMRLPANAPEARAVSAPPDWEANRHDPTSRFQLGAPGVPPLPGSEFLSRVGNPISAPPPSCPPSALSKGASSPPSAVAPLAYQGLSQGKRPRLWSRRALLIGAGVLGGTGTVVAGAGISWWWWRRGDLGGRQVPAPTVPVESTEVPWRTIAFPALRLELRYPSGWQEAPVNGLTQYGVMSTGSEPEHRLYLRTRSKWELWRATESAKPNDKDLEMFGKWWTQFSSSEEYGSVTTTWNIKVGDQEYNVKWFLRPGKKHAPIPDVIREIAKTVRRLP